MTIAIIGKNSYIGNHISERFTTDNIIKVDAKNELWKDVDFSSIDVVIHTAAIVHNKTLQDWNIYYEVNTLLPVEIAKVAKKAGVKQFVFISTMGVFDVGKKLSRNVIDESFVPDATSFYGRSKLQAEELLSELGDENFTVTIVRPPNVYGKDCKGGYITGFAYIVRKIPFIPSAYDNVKQSVIYIDNLTGLIYQLVQKRMGGIYMPQDQYPVSAVELMGYIADGLGLKRRKSKFFGCFAYLLSWTSIAKKAYGGIEYDLKLSEVPGVDYQLVSTAEGIRRTLA